MNWLASTAIKAVLEWLLSLLIRWKEKLDLIEQGKQEVRDALEKKEKEIDVEIAKANKASADTTFDAAVDELLRSASDYDGGSNPLLVDKKPNGGDSSKAK